MSTIIISVLGFVCFILCCIAASQGSRLSFLSMEARVLQRKYDELDQYLCLIKKELNFQVETKSVFGERTIVGGESKRLTALEEYLHIEHVEIPEKEKTFEYRSTVAPSDAPRKK